MTHTALSSQQAVTLTFMEKTIENVNICLAGQYTLFRTLIEKGIVTESELLSRIKEDKNLPQRKKGAEALQEMLTPDWEQYVDLNKKEASEELLRVRSEIYALVLPEIHKCEGIQPPNSLSQRNAYHCCFNIYREIKMIPILITCTRSNGVLIAYDNTGKRLIIEACNDGSIMALVFDILKKENIHKEDIKGFYLDKCIETFK
jgi:hypothetical protein